jgi:hypothetical protein
MSEQQPQQHQPTEEEIDQKVLDEKVRKSKLSTKQLAVEHFELMVANGQKYINSMNEHIMAMEKERLKILKTLGDAADQVKEWKRILEYLKKQLK